MFKVRRWVCLALVCALVGVAYGAARKIRSFTPFAPELATADGMAILNHTGNGDDRTIVQIVLSGFTPFTTYDIGMIPPGVDPNIRELGLGGIGIAIDAITTDENGNGTFHLVSPGDDTSSNVGVYLPFFIDLGPGNGFLRAGHLRALGNP